MLAQRRPGVLGAEEASSHQDWYHMLGEELELARQSRCAQNEAVGGSLREPELDLIGDLLRGTDKPGAEGIQRCGRGTL